MKNKTKALIAATCLSVLSVGLIAGASANFGELNIVQMGVKAAQEEVNFSTKDITRRVWFVNKDNWWTSDELYVHAYGGSLSDDLWSGKASKIYDSYYYGLYYADISGIGAGSAITVQIKNGSGSSADYYTTGVQLPALNAKTSDVVSLWSGLDGEGHRNASLDEAGGTSGFVAVVLEHVLTCDSSYAYGFNAYPQLNANFFEPSSGEITSYGSGTMVDDYDYTAYVANGKSYKDLDRVNDATNVSEKIAKIKELYDNNGWYVAA